LIQPKIKEVEINLNPDIDELYVISDLHSNLPALEAVLSEIPQGSFIICLGDFVGYYVEPNEVCEKIMNLNSYSIVGNHDLYLTEELKFNFLKDEIYRTSWTRSVIKASNLSWLKNLPTSIQFNVFGNVKVKKILAYHGSPENIESYIYPNSEIDIEQFGTKTIILLGNTHHPMVRNHKSNILINPGSVGQPRDYNAMSSYCKINLRECLIDIKRVVYNVSIYQKKLRSYDVNELAINMLWRAKI